MAYIVNVKNEDTEPRDLSENILNKSVPQSSHISLINSSSPLPMLYQHLQKDYSLSKNADENVLVKVETNPCSTEITSSSLTQSSVSTSCFINSLTSVQSNPTTRTNNLKNLPTHIMPKTDLIPVTSSTPHLEEISKIISSLPAGWKVVGLTDLSCDNQSQLYTNVCNNSSPLEGNGNQSVSISLTSTTQLGNNDRNIPENKPSETIYSGDKSKMLHNSHQIILDSGIEPHVILNKEKPFTFSALDQQWTVIGVTSIPQTVVTPSIVTSTSAISSPIVTSKTNDLSQAKNTMSNTLTFPKNSVKTKIIPKNGTLLDGTKVIKVLPDKLLSHESTPEITKSVSCSVSSLPKTSLNKNMLPYQLPVTHEEMKWTIVGITTCLPSENLKGDNTVAPATYQQAPVMSSGSPNNLQCKLSTQEIKTRNHTIPLPQNINSKHYQKVMDNPVLHKQRSEQTLILGSKHLIASNSQIRQPKVDFGESNLEESHWKIVGITSLNPPTVTNSNSDSTSIPPHSVTIQSVPPISNKYLSSPGNVQPNILTCTEPKPMVAKSSVSNISHSPLSKIDVLSKLNHKMLASNSSTKTQNLTGTSVIQDSSSQSNIQSVLTQPIHSSISSSAAPLSPIKWSIVGIVANPCDQTSAPCLPKHENAVLCQKETLTSLHTSFVGITEKVKDHKSPSSDQIVNFDEQFSRQSFVPKIPITESISKDQTRGSNRLIRTPFKQQMKLKDLLRKKGTTPPCIKPKKTVSSMLKHQRWTEGPSKNKNNDKVGCYQKNSNRMFYNDECDLSTHMSAEKSQRLRSLRTYNGNRDTFKKTSSETNMQLKNKDGSADIFPGERKRKRIDYNMDEDNDESGDYASTEISCLDVKTEKNESSEHSCEAKPVSEKDVSPRKERSSSSKRKSKVPQKMVLDMDYQPFESSSDSN